MRVLPRTVVLAEAAVGDGRSEWERAAARAVARAHAPAFPSRFLFTLCEKSLRRCAMRNLHDARHVDMPARRRPAWGARARAHIAQ